MFFGGALLLATGRGVLAIRAGDVQAHQAWMRRAYAIALGAGTQALILGLAALAFGEPGDAGRAWMMGAAWVLNLLGAGWLIRRRRAAGLRGLAG